MEHEVFVPVPVPVLRRTLGDPARVARCVPGLQQDADASAGPLAGRLKVRVGGHTITYRGALRLTALTGVAEGDTAYGVSVTGEGAEARGTGSAKLALTVRLTERDGGTAIGFEGTVGGDGRLVELDSTAALTAAHRLLDRFVQQLVTEALAAHEGTQDPVDGAGDDGADDSVDDGADVDDAAGSASVAGSEERSVGDAVEKAIEEAAEEADGTGAEEAPTTHDAAADEAPAGEQPPERASVFDTPVPPPSLDPVSGIEFTVPDGPPAEAAHARRTMIGRSAEEVDHAPPRGRYAPVPSPDSTGAGATLRWVAPAAALAIASAVVVGRALRRRR
ncbi:carbon monoxide dehydrogenase subunit G [Streptomyces sp. CEV 2-1]|uniref:SRPBCC domain-containing protein n=1 Tax=Streptomyces sp. CEV 2-1 TaxID=2485153 RepID=UPI000FC20584|nr:SRPBCC domain-containing protein [Streptomyces sp. CEV 2-1]ROQ81087.1 carbon monoxide dehydrogenase subunit G [Streptomyces sp. CEV 2-1]